MNARRGTHVCMFLCLSLHICYLELLNEFRLNLVFELYTKSCLTNLISPVPVQHSPLYR